MLDGLDRLHRALGAVAPTLGPEPAVAPTMLSVLRRAQRPAHTLVVRGEGDSLIEPFHQRWRPNALVVRTTSGLRHRLEVLEGRDPDPLPLAWWCQGSHCRVPTADPEQLRQWLDERFS